MSKQDMGIILEMLNTAYGNKFPLNDKISNLWYEIFSDYHMEDIYQAAKRYIRKSEYAPTIAGIMKEYNGMKNEKADDIKRIVNIRNDALADYPTYKEDYHYGAACRAFMDKVGDDVDKAMYLQDCMERKSIQIHNGADYVPVIDFIRSVKL